MSKRLVKAIIGYENDKPILRYIPPEDCYKRETQASKDSKYFKLGRGRYKRNPDYQPKYELISKQLVEWSTK